jgi:CRISPR-associated protein Csx10
MPVLKVSISALAPLVFSERKPGGQFRPSTPYVPGSVIRGALAQQFLDAGEIDGSFRNLFTDRDAPLFRNAYPAYSDSETDGTFISSRPLPATSFSCKAESGFTKQGNHGVFDGLIDRLCCELLGVEVPYLPRCNHPDHKDKGERVEAYGGFYASTLAGKYGASVPIQLSTRAAINRRRRVSEEGLLYSPLVISEAAKDGVITTFHGSVSVNDSNRAVVLDYLPKLTHVGGGASRGFGHVDVKLEGKDEDNLAERVKQFNDLVAQRWRAWGQLLHRQESPYTPDNGTFFSILLISDAILRGEDWVPTVRLIPEMLGSSGEHATLIRSYASVDYRGGWNTAWRLPKDIDLVARIGSVYVFHTTNRHDDETWLDGLRDLEGHGVGLRLVEGYGQVRVCDEFHQEILEVK